MSLCTRILVLAEGRIIAEGTPERSARNPAVIEAYLGATEPRFSCSRTSSPATAG